MSKILIVEDEESIAELEKDYLELSGFEVEIENNGTDGLDRALKEDYDLLILDLMLPGVDGFEICREVRSQKNTPIIMVSAKKDDIDKIRGLGLGADDYMTKPFSPSELVARVKSVLRRTKPDSGVEDQKTSSSRLVVTEDKWIAELDNIRLDLTRREFQLLCALFKRPGRVFSRSQLLELVFPDDADVFDRTIDSHIKNLRRKLKKADPDWDPVRSVYGVGYAYDG